MAKTAKPLSATELSAKKLLDQAGTDRAVKPYSGKAMKLAIFRWFCEEQAVEGDERKALWEAWDGMPMFFGTNASAAQKRLWPESAPEVVEDFEP